MHYKLGDIVDDLCDSGLRVPDVISANFKVLNCTQIDCDNAEQAAKAILKAVGCDDYDGYCDKVAVIIDAPQRYWGKYTAMYSYNGKTLNFFEFQDSHSPHK